MPAAATNAWAIFLDGADFTDYVEQDRIRVRTIAHASTGNLTAEIYDAGASLTVTTNMDTVLVGRKPGSTGSTTLAANSSIGATNIKVASVTGFNATDEIVIGEHPNAELRTITTVGTAGAGGTGITVSVALAKAHSSTDQVYEAERLFAGYIRRTVSRSASSAKVTLITARDYTDLLAADVIDIAFRSVAESDKDRVTWLVQTHGAKGVTAGAEVQQTLASMPPGEDGNPEQDFSGKSLQRAIEQIEKITGASHYVDFNRKLHYFLTEANAAPYSLSTSPNGTSSFGYFDFELPTDSVDTVNAVYVYGAILEGGGQIRGWRPDPPPAAATRRAVVIRDTDVTSATQLAVVGDAYLAEHSTDKRDGSLKTYRSGFRAGQTVQITNGHWGLSATSFFIQQVTLALENGVPVYTIEFGDEKATLGGALGGAVSAADEALRVANAAMASTGSLADLSIGGANMLTNSSFESSAYTGWTIGSGWLYGYPPTGGQLAFAGTQVARLAPAGAAAGALTTPLIAIDRLDDWWVSYWSFLRSRSSGSVQAKVLQYDAAQAYIAADLTLPSPGSTVETAWTRHSIHLGPNTDLGRTAFHANAAFIKVSWDDASTGTFVWDIDAVQVERSDVITAWTPTPYELTEGSVTSDMISGGAIVETHIQPGSITTPLLGALAVSADKIASNAIVAGKIAAGVITSAHIATSGLDANLVTSGQLRLGGLAGHPEYLVVYDVNDQEIGRWGTDGLLISDEGNPLMKMRLMNGELQFASEEDGSGNPLWRTAISAEGIRADAINLGTFPGGSNRVENSGFEMAEFSSLFTKIWTSAADWGTTIGTDVNINKSGTSLTLTTVTY